MELKAAERASEHYPMYTSSFPRFDSFHIFLSRYAVPVSAYSRGMAGSSNFGGVAWSRVCLFQISMTSPQSRPCGGLRVDARVRG